MFGVAFVPALYLLARRTEVLVSGRTDRTAAN